MTNLLRMALNELSMSVIAYYLVHHGNKDMSLDMQNFTQGVKFSLNDRNGITDAELHKLLAVGIDVAREDGLDASPLVSAALTQITRDFPEFALVKALPDTKMITQ